MQFFVDIISGASKCSNSSSSLICLLREYLARTGPILVTTSTCIILLHAANKAQNARSLQNNRKIVLSIDH